MEFTNTQIEEFKTHWREQYGVELTDAEARESLTNLIGLFQVLLDIDTRMRKRG